MTLEEKRRMKHPNTSTFFYHNANPKGKITTDCVIRALSAGMQKPYAEVVMDLARMQCETGFDDGDTSLIDKYLKMNGWVRCKQPKKPDGTKYTGKEFCLKLQHPVYIDELETMSIYNYDHHHVIADIGGHHIVAIIDGMVWDTWNSTRGSIGIVWVREI